MFVIITMVVAAGLGTYAFVLPDQYAASGIVALRPKDAKPVSAQVVLLTAPRYVAYATSPYVVKEVADSLGIDADELADAIVVTMPAGTANVEFKVLWSSRGVAERATAELMAAVLNRVEADPILAGQLVSPAAAALEPAGPPRWGITGVGVVLGVLLAGAAVWVRERRSRRTEDWIVPATREPSRTPVG